MRGSAIPPTAARWSSASTIAGRSSAGRIVDLSYTAALKLDLLRGVAPVELERITFDEIRTGAWRGSGAHARARRRSRRPIVAGDAAVDDRAAADAVAIATGHVPAQDVALRRRRIAPPSLSAPLAVRPPPPAARGFWVQLGAFRERDGAESFRRRVGADARIVWLEPLLAIFGDPSLYRVQAGPYPQPRRGRSSAARARSALGVVPIVVERR